MIAGETKRALDYARIKDANAMTKGKSFLINYCWTHNIDDYQVKKNVIHNKLEKMYEKAYSG